MISFLRLLAAAMVRFSKLFFFMYWSLNNPSSVWHFHLFVFFFNACFQVFITCYYLLATTVIGRKSSLATQGYWPANGKELKIGTEVYSLTIEPRTFCCLKEIELKTWKILRKNQQCVIIQYACNMQSSNTD